MRQALQSWLSKLGSSGVDAAAPETRMAPRSTGIDLLELESLADSPALRLLTIERYNEQPIKRRIEAPCELRPGGDAETALLSCGYAYAWHDHRLVPHHGSPNAVTFAIEVAGQPVTAATLVLDTGPCGLAAKTTFPDEVAALRRLHGTSLCELTSFTLHKEHRSRRMLAALLQSIHSYARQTRQLQGLLVQTQPRHAAIYTDLLGFERLAHTSSSVLLFIRLEHMRQKIRAFAGQHSLQGREANLYKFFLPAPEEAALLYRVLKQLREGRTAEG